MFQMKRIVFLISDTGGGHRAAGRAIEAALNIRYPGAFETFYVDVFREYTPPPMKYAPEIYPKWVKHSIKTYGWYFWVFDQVMQLPLARNTLPTIIAEDSVKKLVADYQPDMIVVLHGAFTAFVVGVRKRLKIDIPVITVITDLAKPHVAWYHPGVDRCLVPCEAAYERGLKLGVPAEKLHLVGHPAHPKFALYKGSKHSARNALNWAPDVPAVMLLGGGGGMGFMAAIAEAINARAMDIQLSIICGKNEALRKKMEGTAWNQQTYIYGFVNNIEAMMHATDVLITKAGPGTIAEAAICGLPLILNDAIPYQESPNIDFVIDGNAGVFETDPEKIVDILETWLLKDPTILPQMSENASRLAFPNASFDIADEIAAWCNIPVPA